MSYIDKHLLANEHVVFRTTRHWFLFVPPFVIAIIAVVFLLQHSLLTLVGYTLLVLAAVLWIYALLTSLGSEYVVTNKRVLIKTGFFRRDSYEALLQRVAGVQVGQSAWGRLFDYGNIIVYGIGGDKEQFLSVAQPITFRHNVLQQSEVVHMQDEDVVVVKKNLEDF